MDEGKFYSRVYINLNNIIFTKHKKLLFFLIEMQELIQLQVCYINSFEIQLWHYINFNNIHFVFVLQIIITILFIRRYQCWNRTKQRWQKRYVIYSFIKILIKWFNEIFFLLLQLLIVRFTIFVAGMCTKNNGDNNYSKGKAIFKFNLY